MDSITRSVKDIESADRQALEHVLGRHLSENQQIIIQVQNVPSQVTPRAGSATSPSPQFPDWCNVYEGLSDAEIADIENSIVRSHLTRSLR